jgi:hypothetical protein
MEQKKTNQEKGRKYGGTSSFVDAGVPSKAPRQDEDPGAFAGTNPASGTTYEPGDDRQGISNRPAREEHALPDSERPDDAAADTSVETTQNKQVGGNRGGV